MKVPNLLFRVVAHVFFAFIVFIRSLAQPGTLDSSFNPTDIGFGNGDGLTSPPESIAVQLDGKVLIGGSFTHYNGTAKNGVARLNPDGSLDISFNTGTGVNAKITALALQPDGKVLIVGGFSSYNSTAINGIARLNTDGSLDMSFKPGLGANKPILSLALQPDGKVLIGGWFTSYNGAAINRIARLNADGSLDTSFNPGTGPNNNYISSLALQPDGKVLIVGDFSSYNGTAINGIARLNTDGSLDTSFNPGVGPNASILTLTLQPDGRILIGGSFTSYNGTYINRIARLNADGSLDMSFNAGTGSNGFIRKIALQSDDQILIGGSFTIYNGMASNYIARLNADGSLDTSFNPSTVVNSEIQEITIQTNGKVLIGGLFNGLSQNRITRLNADGSLDRSFNPGTGANSTVRVIAVKPDDKVLIGGTFTSYNGTVIGRIAGLNADGSLDTSFNPGTGANNKINALTLQADGKVLIAGWFTSYNGIASDRIARLNADGSLDTGFNHGTGVSGDILVIAVQPDGKVLIGGWFTRYDGIHKNNIARLNTDGSLDTSFEPGTGTNNVIYSLALQSDGRLLIGGNFTSYNDTVLGRIARLNADGSLDTSFNPGTGANNKINTIILQPDGKVLIGGSFTSYNGIARNRIARLNADGSLDTSFNPGIEAFGEIYSLALQPDGRVLIGGWFTGSDGIEKNIERLNTDGSLDTSFKLGTGTIIYSLALQSDGRVLIGGDFTEFNGSGRNRIARVIGGAVISPPLATDATSATPTGFTANWNAVTGATGYRLDVSADNFATFVSGFNNKIVANTSYAVTGLSANTAYKYRVRAANALGISVNSNEISVMTTPKQEQTISFSTLPDRTIGHPPFTLSATASSGLAVQYMASSPERVIISGSTIALQSAGRVTITASQAGNEQFLPAADVDQSFCIKPAKPTVSIISINLPEVTLTSSSTTGNQWYVNGNPIPGATNQTLTVTEQGNYAVQATVDDCVSEISTTFSLVITGIEAPFAKGISVYPNPVEDALTIEIQECFKNASIELVDVSGRKVQSKQVQDKKTTLSMCEVRSGFLLLRITSDEGIFFYRIIKK